ncbi:hypothetical protein CL2_07630 [Anaerostipes hadrus]|uniref:Methylglyoxal synthase n=1 Tax=Anaerostipes hadrus TaxID=649756 RepID=D4MYV0_ANAHA|nr:hypothetical protein CL2_07630 [Anaerostipes hadrus]
MNVGLVAHDGKKNLMQNLCIAYQDILKNINYMLQVRLDR